MPYQGPISLPYHPAGKRSLKPSRYSYTHRIAYTETMRGDSDDVPALMFLGAPPKLLQDVGTALCKEMNGKLQDIILEPEHSCRWKNGKHYWRTVAHIIGLDTHFISFNDFTQLFVFKMTKTATCTVKHYKFDTFINL